jgi:hypothetical protein
VSDHSPDALSAGFDGTEAPAPLPDPSGRDGWRDAPDLAPLTLPPLPNARLMREAVAAALGEDFIGLVAQDPGAAPAPPPAGRPAAQAVGWPTAASARQPAVALPSSAGSRISHARAAW